MNDTVSFDKHGDYHIGDPIQDMNVQTERGENPQQAPQMQHVKLHQPPTMAQKAQPAVKPRGGFDLQALRQRAGVQKQETSAPEPEVKSDVAPTSQPAPAVEEYQPEHPKEELKQEVAASMGESDDIPAPEVRQEEPKEETSAQAEVPETSAPDGRPTSFKLSQLGLVQETATSEGVDEQGMNGALSLGSDGIKKMDVTQGVAVTGQYENKSGASEASSAVKTSAPAVTEEEAMNFADETPFEVVSLDELIHIVKASKDYVASWVARVLHEQMRNPTGIFASKAYENLRAYSAVQSFGKGNTTYVTLGVGKKITVVAFDNKRQGISDASSEISVSGTCAIVQEMPVASCSQRSVAAKGL